MRNRKLTSITTSGAHVLVALPSTQAGMVGSASRCVPLALLTCVQVLKSADRAIWMFTTPFVVAKEYQYPLAQMMLGSGKLDVRTGPDSVRFSRTLIFSGAGVSTPVLSGEDFTKRHVASKVKSKTDERYNMSFQHDHNNNTFKVSRKGEAVDPLSIASSDTVVIAGKVI